jgi:EAL domain-containing protein (putative c-di-GMP-specific phosphodiesterase class I)
LADIREALGAERIQAVYQPVVRLSDRVPVCLEVLARLDHPERGRLAPDLFVPQIEDAGLGFALTREVVARAFEEWGGAALERLDLTLAFNFPLDVLLHPAMPMWLDERREAAGIAVERVWIELTETSPVTDLADLTHAITCLREAGYSLAIDDVGPGAREAQHLLGIGFSALKLDKGLVRGSRDDPAMAALLTETVAAAQRNGLFVVAEGIEDQECWRRMVAAGVEEAQGYLIARPMPAGEVAAWYRTWRSGDPAAAIAPTI